MSLPLSQKAGEEPITLPDDFLAMDHELIAFVQNTATGEISAAAKTAFTRRLLQVIEPDLSKRMLATT